MLVAATTGLTACSSAVSSNDSTASNDKITAPGADALNGAGQVTLTFWHAMSGANGEALQNLVSKFNSEHKGKIKVNLIFKRDYDPTLDSYKNASDSERPDVVQIYDIGTRYMIDSNTVVPIQSFIDKDKSTGEAFDTSDIQPNIAGYYTVNDRLYSMPFNTSMPLLYFNRDAFTKAGLDPNKPPQTLDEITADAKKIKQAKNIGVQYGFGASLYGWFFEQSVAKSNEMLCDADNGRKGRPTKVSLVTDNNLALMRWWKRMTDQGLAQKLDSDTKKGDTAFTSGTSAISLESTGSLGGFIADSKFKVGTGFYPKVSASDAGGQIIGGASLWVVGRGKDDKHKRAGWELVKFLASPQSQATWHTKTGYFPISKMALDTDIDKKWVARNPQFSTAIKQLRGTRLSTATQGCSVGVLPQIRKEVENAMQAVVLQGTDPKQALRTAQQKSNQEIADYNSKLGG